MSLETKIRLAILASGGGSNADKICTYFSSHPTIKADLIISNRKAAGVFKIANTHGIESAYIPKKNWSDSVQILDLLHSKKITHLVLAGFLLQIPDWLIHAYPGRIINIHPALLPRYGGQGMYGHHVHEAVKEAGDLVSGITIHEVNENYDEGKIIFQQEVLLNEKDSPENIGSKILKVEHASYSKVIEEWVGGNKSAKDIQA